MARDRSLEMVDPVTIGIGVNKWLKDANTKLITLAVGGNSASYTALKDSTNADYTPAAGRKFIALKIQVTMNEGVNSGNTGFFAINNDTAAGGSGGTRLLEYRGYEQNTGSTAGAAFFQMDLDVFLEDWTAGEYVNISYNSTNYWGVLITGIETTV